MQRSLFSLIGNACAACLIIPSTGCGGGSTDAITREIRAADAAAHEAETDAASIEEEAEEDAAVEVPAEDAAEPVETDASDESDGGADATDAASAPIEPGPSTPQNYLRPEDSPFAGVDFAYFHLEDFEDHLLDTPGLRSQGQLSSSFSAAVIDSVDGDDGNPDDNRCLKADGICDAWWGPGTLTFSFDLETLGALPTHVGGVWTDGLGQVSFEVFGPDGASIYKVGPLSEPGFPDDTTSSSTGEDRFFGAYAPAGISAFTISNTQGGVEMDHVQYGRAR
jgi:hypothetical protein